MSGYEFTQREHYGISAQRRDYDNDLLPYLSAGSTVHSASDNANASALISGFVRVNYNYESKYMASASFRRDGSSRFGPANKWGSFPSLSAGWRISEENFMQNMDVLSNLNLRASYGFTGNENIGNYRWISSMSQARVAFGDNIDMSYYPSSVQNPGLRWERTKQQNIGLDLGLFRDRIFIETDFYNSTSDDLLLNVPIPSTSGFNSMLRNIGEMRNRGFELKVTSYNLTGELSWRTLLTYSANRNEVTRLGPDDAPMVFGPASSMEMINMVGHPIFSFYGLQYDGVYMSQTEVTGDPAYLNMVRERVGLPPYGSPEYPSDLYPTFAEAIEHERRVELAFEFHRFFDLVRTGRALEVMHSKGYTNLTEESLLFPIPQHAIDVNPDLTQNPG